MPSTFAKFPACVTAGLSVVLVGCADPSSVVDLESPDPGAQIRAVRLAAQGDDRESVGVLIRALESDDAAVRLLAIRSLERETGGETFGYDHAALHDVRAAALQRWVDWYGKRYGGRA